MKINFELLGGNKKIFVKEVFLIRGLEVGKVILFPVWIIPSPVLKIDYEKHFEREIFDLNPYNV